MLSYIVALHLCKLEPMPDLLHRGGNPILLGDQFVIQFRTGTHRPLVLPSNNTGGMAEKECTITASIS
jgi:hypothetical protein